MSEMLRGRFPLGLTSFFLATINTTSATGFLFPPQPVGPPHIVGIISLIALSVALVAIYRGKLKGPATLDLYRSALVAPYLNVFVVAQAFAKLTPLEALAPSQSEPPFLLAQGAVLILFIGLGIAALRPRDSRLTTSHA